MKDDVEIIHAIPDYDGPGVYALIDQRGKKYIGSSLNVKTRIYSHDVNLRRVLREGQITYCSVGKKMAAAVLSGSTFNAFLIQKLPKDGSFYDLIDLERSALIAAGGCENTYNAVPIKDYRTKDRNLLRLWERESTERAKRIASELRDKISQREQPLKGSSNIYDRINLTVPKGQKEVIKSHAEAQGESVNGFINRAIEETMERDAHR